MTIAPAPQAERLGWVDAAKGISITLVVLFHATLVDATPPDSGPWWVLNAVFATLRMPLFFLASGLFAGSVLRRSWPEVLRGRVLLLVYVYALWVTLRQAFFGLVDGRLDLTWRSYLLPDSDMWFLYVLAVFFVVARALSPVPVGLQLAAAAGVSLVVSSLEWDVYRLDEMLAYFVFFLAGCHWSGAIRERAARVGWYRTAGVWGAFLVASVAVAAADLGTVPPFRFLLSVAALAAGVTLAVVLARFSSGRLMGYLGRITLPIYVLHALVITVTVRLLNALGWDVQAALVGPLLLAAVSLAASVALYQPLQRVPGLFATPRWLGRAVGGGGGPRRDRPPVGRDE